MVDWLAGKRVKGTSSERTTSYAPKVGGWVQLGRTTLNGTSTSITVSGLSNKRYLMVLSDLRSSVTLFPAYRLNSDQNSNYASRYSSNGGADGSDTSGTAMYTSGDSNPLEFNVQYYANYASKEKLLINHSVWAGGAGTAPSRRETVNKHVQTTNPISAITTFSQGGQNYNANSELVVLGWDPADTHTNNFWEELASVQGTGSSNVLDSGVFTAKKYLWIQQFTDYGSGAHISPQLQVGYNTIDTGNNYATRYNENGGTDGTVTPTNVMGYGYVGGADVYPSFSNTFIINNASNEKLAITHANDATGSGTAPTRSENVGKWTNTSNQINRVQFTNTGNVSTNSWLKVWGAD